MFAINVEALNALKHLQDATRCEFFQDENKWLNEQNNKGARPVYLAKEKGYTLWAVYKHPIIEIVALVGEEEEEYNKYSVGKESEENLSNILVFESLEAGIEYIENSTRYWTRPIFFLNIEDDRQFREQYEPSDFSTDGYVHYRKRQTITLG